MPKSRFLISLLVAVILSAPVYAGLGDIYVSQDAPQQQQKTQTASTQRTGSGTNNQSTTQQTAQTSQSQQQPLNPQAVAGMTPAQFEADALKRVDSGDSAGARQEIAQALAQHPDDRQLQIVDQLLTQRVSTPWTSESLKRKIDALGSLQDAGAAPQVELASPISWPGMAASRAPLSGSAVPPSAGLAAKDALGKLRVGDYSGAERDLSLSLAKSPRWQDYLARALARRGLHNLEGARQDTGRAIDLNPKNGWPYKVRAQIENDLGLPKDAVQDANAALALDPKDADALVARAQAEEKLGERTQQLNDLYAAADLDPALQDLYRKAMEAGAPRASSSRWQARTQLLYLGASGLALLLLAVPVFAGRRRYQTTASRPAMRRADRLAPGGVVQNFQIVRQLGQGGMGVVFEGFDTSLQRKVALKQMREEIAGNPRERRRFVKEARTVAALRHPNIIEIYSLVDDGESLVLVFEFLDGKTLDCVLAERGRLSPAEALAVADQMGRALDCAHAAGIVHQDLKPANVILSGGSAKVMDFGIARRVQETLSTLSRAEAAGTPAYMAPEQEMGRYDARSDVYALGVCVYEMLAGRRPFEGGLFAQKAAMAFPPLSSALPDLPKAADEAVARALSPNPALRPASAQAFLAELSSAFA